MLNNSMHDWAHSNIRAYCRLAVAPWTRDYILVIANAPVIPVLLPEKWGATENVEHDTLIYYPFNGIRTGSGVACMHSSFVIAINTTRGSKTWLPYICEPHARAHHPHRPPPVVSHKIFKKFVTIMVNEQYTRKIHDRFRCRWDMLWFSVRDAALFGGGALEGFRLATFIFWMVQSRANWWPEWASTRICYEISARNCFLE